MKRKLFLLFVMLVTTAGMKAQEAYAVVSEDMTTLTFYYDDKKDSREGIAYGLNTYDYTENRTEDPGWWHDYSSSGNNPISTVIFDSTFANARPNTTHAWFAGMRKLTTIQGIQYLNTEEVMDMAGMFSICSSLTSLDLSNFDTQNVTNMEGMFSVCSSLTSLDVSNLDTQNVTNMGSMFSSCSSLTSLDVSNLDTQNVTSMGGMFYGCSSLTSLDVSNLDTQNVTNMGNMFYGCSSLMSLDVSNLDTQNVTSMGGMFSGCSSLTSLDLSNFDTQNVKSMSSMFSGCSSLTSLNLSNFNTQNVEWIDNMLNNCSSLTSLDLSNFDTQNVKSMRSMFSDCSSLTSLNLSNFDTQNVTNMFAMFYSCSSLTSLDLSNFDTQKVTNMSAMFYSCSSLTSLDLSNFDTQKVTDMSSMFSGCSSLTSLDLRNFNTQNLMSSRTSYTFSRCSSLKSLMISSSLGKKFGRNTCSGVGTEENPCIINQPEGFDFGVDTSGDYFVWKGGYFKLEEVLAEKINVTTDLGYMTYCSDKTLDFTNVEGMKAYIVVGYDGKVAKLSRIGIVPAETGLLLKAGAGEYEVPYTEEDNYVMNMLIGVLEETTLAPTEGNMTNLVLANGNNGLGFYRLKGSGTLAAHRAYLQVPTRLIANGAKYIKMEFDDETTAIDGVMTQEETSAYYDMQGVRHEGKPSKQGVYIMNGKKIVVTDNGY